jgi:hypothetical protein
MAFDMELVSILVAMAVITFFWWIMALHSSSFTPWLFRKWIKAQRKDINEQSGYTAKQRKTVQKAYMRASAVFNGKEED